MKAIFLEEEGNAFKASAIVGRGDRVTIRDAEGDNACVTIDFLRRLLAAIDAKEVGYESHRLETE